MKGILKVCNEKYIANEEKGIVTYFIEFEPKNYVSEHFESSYYRLTKTLCKNFNKNYLQRCFTVTGISKCSPEDTFDLKKGIQIARNRAEIKLAQIEQQLIRILCKEIGQFWDYTSALYNNRSEMIKEKKEFIKNI